MTLKPFYPVAKPGAHKRAIVPGGSPWAPAAAAPPATVDPAVYAAKKADFISKLFSGLGPAAGGAAAGAPPMGPIVPPDFWMPPAPPTTPSPDDPMSQAALLAQLVDAVVNAPEPTEPAPPPFIPPTPKPTIVPPGFWVPDSPIVAPGAYKAKVATFLGKLFSSLNITMGPPAAGGAKVARRSRPQTSWVRDLLQTPPMAPAAAPAAGPAPASPDPKDMVVNSILSEVAQLKTAFMDTLGDMLAKQKEIAAAAPTKKPKFLPPWIPTPPPTADPMEPFQKRIDTLGQVFDMLTNLGKEVTGPAAPTNGSTTRAVRSVSPMRSVQMAVHQGYQSMPPGTEEVISAGAGRDPNSNNEGGGLNLKVNKQILT